MCTVAEFECFSECREVVVSGIHNFAASLLLPLAECFPFILPDVLISTPQILWTNIFHVLENKLTHIRKCFVLSIYLFLYLHWNCSPFSYFMIILCDVPFTFNKQLVTLSAIAVDHPCIIFRDCGMYQQWFICLE